MGTNATFEPRHKGTLAPGETFAERGECIILPREIDHQATIYAAGGAFVDDRHLVCYPAAPDVQGGPMGDVRTWSGRTIGRYRVTGRASGWRDESGRRTPLVCYRIQLEDGRCYVGKGLGSEMMLRARRAAQDSF